MNVKLLLFVISAATISGCSNVYKTGQTPDDVYYSPVRVVEENYSQEKRREEDKPGAYRDRDAQMCVYDRRWRDFNDDYDYRYDPYRYGYSYGYYYNPYYCYYPVYISNVTISNPKSTIPRMTNLGSYNNTTYAVHNTKTSAGNYLSNPKAYNNSNNINSYIRRILSSPTPIFNSNDRSSRSSENSTRSYTPSSGSSSGSSSGGSGTPVRRPGKG